MWETYFKIRFDEKKRKKVRLTTEADAWSAVEREIFLCRCKYIAVISLRSTKDQAKNRKLRLGHETDELFRTLSSNEI